MCADLAAICRERRISTIPRLTGLWLDGDFLRPAMTPPLTIAASIGRLGVVSAFLAFRACAPSYPVCSTIQGSCFDADLQLFARCFMLVTSRVCPAPAVASEVLEALEELEGLEAAVLPVICTS